MDTKFEALDTKIAKLKERKKRIKEEKMKRLASCVNQISDKIDMGTLIGMILDAPKIIHENQKKKEVWQIAGEKFFTPRLLKQNRQLLNITQHINRFERKKTHHLHRIVNTAMDLRKARTRTLVQLGGLIFRSGLLDDLNLAPGDDLQKDPDSFDSVAILMVALCELRQNFHTDDAPAQKLLWSERGKEMLSTK